MRYGRVTVGEDEFRGDSVVLMLPKTGTKLVRVTSWGRIKLHVYAESDAAGKIVLMPEDRPGVSFDITIAASYELRDGLLLLPLESYSELQKAFNKVLGLLSETRQQLNVLRGLPENDGLDFGETEQGETEQGEPEQGDS